MEMKIHIPLCAREHVERARVARERFRGVCYVFVAAGNVFDFLKTKGKLKRLLGVWEGLARAESILGCWPPAARGRGSARQGQPLARLHRYLRCRRPLLARRSGES